VRLTIGRRRFLIGGAALAASAAVPRGPVAWTIDTGNKVLAPAARDGDRLAFAGEARVGLVDGRAGRLLWARDLAEGAAARFRPRLADTVMLTGAAGAFFAWGLEDGRPLWRAEPERAFGAPLIYKGTVLAGDGHRLVARDLASGVVRWSFDTHLDTDIHYAPAATGDTVFVCGGDGVLNAVDVGSGRSLWRVDRAKEWQYLRQLHIWNDILVGGAYQEKLHGLDVATGTERWSFYAGNFINSHLVADGSAYLWSPTGWLYAIDAVGGAVRWRHRTTDYGKAAGNWAPLMAELAVEGGDLFALDMADVLHVLDTASGRERHRLAVGERLRPFVVPLGPGLAAFGTQDGRLLGVAI
jgi:outer membrane protein assembly factor BamB